MGVQEDEDEPEEEDAPHPHDGEAAKEESLWSLKDAAEWDDDDAADEQDETLSLEERHRLRRLPPALKPRPGVPLARHVQASTLDMLERLLRSPEFAFTEEAVLLESARLIFARPGARSAHVGTWYQWLEAQGLWRVEERWQRWLAASTDDIIAGTPVPPPPAPVGSTPRQATRASHASAATLGSEADFDPRRYQPRPFGPIPGDDELEEAAAGE